MPHDENMGTHEGMGYKGAEDQFDSDLKKVHFLARKQMYCGRDFEYDKIDMLEELIGMAGISDAPDAVKRAVMLAYSAGVMQGDLHVREEIIRKRHQSQQMPPGLSGLVAALAGRGR